MVTRKQPETAQVSLLQQAIRDLQERIKLERLRERQRKELADYVAKRPQLTRKDLIALAGSMPGRAKRGSRAVESSHKVGQVIKEARERKGLSRTQLADKIDASHGSIYQWEQGGIMPGPKLRAKLVRALGIPATALANGDARPAA